MERVIHDTGPMPIYVVIRRIILIIIGILLVGGITYLIFSGYKIPGFNIEYELEGDTYQFDITFWIYLAALIIGELLITLGLKLSRLPENMIISFPLSRFLSGLLLLALSLAAFILFGVSFGGYDTDGLWLFLGGLSLWFPTALIPTVFGIILIIASLTRFVKMKFSQSCDGKELVIQELTGLRSMVTVIPVSEINAARLTNARTGPKHFWILPFIIPIMLLYIDGFSFLLNPNAFGSALIVGIAYLTSGTVQLIVVVLLTVNTQHFFEIITKDRLYELHVYPINWKSWMNTNLGFMLQLPGHGMARSQEFIPIAGVPCEDIKQPTDLKRLIAGITFIILAIFARIYFFWAGEILRFVLIIVGIILVIEAIKNDLKFVHGRMRVMHLPLEDAFLITGKGMIFRSEYMVKKEAMKNRPEVSKPFTFAKDNSSIQLRKLALTDHAIATAIPFVIGLQSAPAFIFYNIAEILIYDAGGLIINILVLLLIGMILLNPVRVLKIKLGDRNYQIPMKVADDEDLFSRFVSKYSKVVKGNPKLVVLRVVEIMIALALGFLVGFVL